MSDPPRRHRLARAEHVDHGLVDGEPELRVSTLVAHHRASLPSTRSPATSPLLSDVRHPIVLFQGVLTVLAIVNNAAEGILGGVAVVLRRRVVDRALRFTSSSCCSSHVPASFHGCRGRNAGEHPAPAGRRREASETTTAAPSRILLYISRRHPRGRDRCRSRNAIADQTGLGAGFVGMLIAIAPAPRGDDLPAPSDPPYELAFGDAFGTNLFSTMAISRRPAYAAAHSRNERRADPPDRVSTTYPRGDERPTDGCSDGVARSSLGMYVGLFLSTGCGEGSSWRGRSTSIRQQAQPGPPADATRRPRDAETRCGGGGPRQSPPLYALRRAEPGTARTPVGRTRRSPVARAVYRMIDGNQTVTEDRSSGAASSPLASRRNRSPPSRALRRGG